MFSLWHILSILKADYTFDGKYFENRESIGNFQLIINLKNAIKQENEEELNECVMILENQHPKFMFKHEDSFDLDKRPKGIKVLY